MNGLIMDIPLTIDWILRRTEQLHHFKKVVTRLPHKTYHEYTYGDMAVRAKKLAAGLKKLGLNIGDRVGTLCWNHYQHLEAYCGIPAAGMVLHTLNLRLHPDDLIYIINHAGDKAIIVDDVLLPLLMPIRERIDAQHIIVVPLMGNVPPGTINYESLLADSDAKDYVEPRVDERAAASICYTSGTTGKPKGVVYSHRAIMLHSMAGAMVDTMASCESDIIVPVVPMFHANAWGLPYTCALTGATQVFPGPHLDPLSLLELFQEKKATITAGVPTIWLGMLQILDKNPKAYDLSSLKTMVVGGSAAPPDMIRGFQERHGLTVLHAWGMTELCPIGTVGTLPSYMKDAPLDEQYAYRAKQGRPASLVEIRARGADGLIPWDGQAVGELEVRGPWIASAYYNPSEKIDSFTEDGWFRTGDIVSIDPRGTIQIQDRAKDVIKSGGEWISSVALENALMGHPAVAEAAVISVFHPKWAERPLAVCVLKDGARATQEDLLAFLEPHFAKWWLPDAIEFISEIPKTSVGKFQKSALRERFKDYQLATK